MYLGIFREGAVGSELGGAFGRGCVSDLAGSSGPGWLDGGSGEAEFSLLLVDLRSAF